MVGLTLNVPYNMSNVFNRRSYSGPDTAADSNLAKIMVARPAHVIGQLGACCVLSLERDRQFTYQYAAHSFSHSFFSHEGHRSSQLLNA